MEDGEADSIPGGTTVYGFSDCYGRQAVKFHTSKTFAGYVALAAYPLFMLQ